MSTTWFTSDLHLGHEFVSRLRGFDSDTDWHDGVIFRNWRDRVSENDRVWVLGDIAMKDFDYALDCLATLPGEKHLIAGNHDSVSPIHRQGWKHTRRYLEVFSSVQAYGRIRIRRQDVLMSHYPYLGDGDDHTEEARCQQWRLPDLGAWLLHGHTHNADQRRHGKQIHVGLDAWGLCPVPLSKIEELMFREGEG